MNMNWTFGQRLAAGYAMMLLFVLIISAVAIIALRGAVARSGSSASTGKSWWTSGACTSPPRK